MLPTDTSILATETQVLDSVSCRYRLIQSFDGLTEREIYALFVTTDAEITEEAFVFDIACCEQDAFNLFHALVAARATACTLRETVYALLTSL